MKYKAVAVLLLYFVTCCVAAVLGVVCLGVAFGLGVFACLVLVGILAIVLNEKLLPAWFKAEEPTSFFRDLSWRNADKLVLGSTKLWNHLDRRDDQRAVYALPVYRCSLKSQFDMLKCYFGHLKSRGEVLYFIDAREAVKLSDAVNPLDVHFIHRLVYMASGDKPSDDALRFPLLAFPLYSLGYVFTKIARCGCGPRRKRFLKQPSSAILGSKKICEHIMAVDGFCRERDLRVVFCLVGVCDAESISERLGSDVEIASCVDVAQMNSLVWGS